MKREVIVLSGRVHGVGFRDTVVDIAGRFAVAGTVRNVASGLEIDVEGDPVDVERFLAAVLAEPPPAARVTGVARRPAAALGRRSFDREASG